MSAWSRSLAHASLGAALLAGELAATPPSAADLLRGAIDLHCHSGPDTVPRSVNDFELAREAQRAGLRAVVIKNHSSPTAARAQLAMSAVPAIDVFGGIVLNLAVGGINVEAVHRLAEMEGRRGKVVWLPTFDAQHMARTSAEKRETVPVLSDGRPSAAMSAVLSAVAKHHLVLATGHSSPEECQVIVTAALEAGVKHVIVTHALFPPLGLSDDDLRGLSEQGAWIELSWLMHHTPSAGPNIPPPFARPMVPLARAVEVIRMLGPDRILLSSDFGQATNPTPVNGLHDFLSALLAAGVSVEDLRRMVQHNPARVLGLEHQE